MYYPLLYSVQFLFLCLPASTSTQSTGPEPCIFYCPSYAALWPRAQHTWSGQKSPGGIQPNHTELNQPPKSTQESLLSRKPDLGKPYSRDAILRKQGNPRSFIFPIRQPDFQSRKNGCCHQRPWANGSKCPYPIRTHSKWDSVALTEQVL